MGKFTRVTVVSIVGHNNGAQAMFAINRTVGEMPGAKGLLLSLERPPDIPPGIEFVRISPLSYDQYSMFVVHCLYYHIRTDYALIVQADGWALNGNSWNDEWFEYDLIGAPIHVAGIDDAVHTAFRWVDNPAAVPVLNGGFSLRSRRLLEAPTRYGICYRHPDVPLLRNEDVQLCLFMRNELEHRGIRFAPLEVALLFSVEYMHPALHRHFYVGKVFGHHAQTRRLSGASAVTVAMTQSQVDAQFGERRILSLLERYGYSVMCKHPSAQGEVPYR